jgi:quercetin dioxygenase-like cupin family protein
LYLAQGEAELIVEEDGSLVSNALQVGDSYHIRANTRHRMVAGEGGCEFIEVSTPELDDVVRLEDRYGRT